MKRVPLSFGLLIAWLVLGTASLFADSTGGLYPGFGTTVNGKTVYFSVAIAMGSDIKTAGMASTITLGGAELEMEPYSQLIIGDPVILNCGSIIVRSGSAQVSDGKHAVSVSAGQRTSSYAPFCGAILPDAPSAMVSDHSSATSRDFRRNRGGAPVAARGGEYVDFRAASLPYWTLTAAMFSSSFLSADLTQKCLRAGACTDVPDFFRTRKAMYGAGLPAAAAVSYFSYYLKRKHSRWWWLPEAAVIGGNVVVSAHAARYSH